MIQHVRSESMVQPRLGEGRQDIVRVSTSTGRPQLAQTICLTSENTFIPTPFLSESPFNALRQGSDASEPWGGTHGARVRDATCRYGGRTYAAGASDAHLAHRLCPCVLRAGTLASDQKETYAVGDGE